MGQKSGLPRNGLTRKSDINLNRQSICGESLVKFAPISKMPLENFLRFAESRCITRANNSGRRTDKEAVHFFGDAAGGLGWRQILKPKRAELRPVISVRPGLGVGWFGAAEILIALALPRL